MSKFLTPIIKKYKLMMKLINYLDFMAFLTLNLKHPDLQIIKQAPVGFSWTVFFFSFFPPVFRDDWKWALIILVGALFTFGFSTLVFMFIYNKLYVQSLLLQGYTSVDSEVVLEPIEAKLGLKIPRNVESKAANPSNIEIRNIRNS